MGFSRAIYVTNLPANVKKSEIEDLFNKYGRVLDVDLNFPSLPPCACLIEFETYDEAAKAVRECDGYELDGCFLKVELATGPYGSSSRTGTSTPYRVGTPYRVIVSGLPHFTIQENLMTYMKKAGDVWDVEVLPDTEGTVAFVNYTNLDDMNCAIRTLDGTLFGDSSCKSRIEVKRHEYNPPMGCRRSRSPRRNISKSLERSTSQSRSVSPK